MMNEDEMTTHNEKKMTESEEGRYFARMAIER